MPRDLGQRAQDFREKWLAPSGGWLAELTIALSDLTGVWDLLILSAIFVASWIIIRTSPMEIGGILGLIFDLTIPLQYSNDEDLADEHAYHLDGYWPVQLIGAIIEGASFFLLHPDLFTLIVCIKTTFCTLFWLSRDQDGDSILGSRSGRVNQTIRVDPPEFDSEAEPTSASSISEPYSEPSSDSDASSSDSDDPSSRQRNTQSSRSNRSTHPEKSSNPSRSSSSSTPGTQPPATSSSSSGRSSRTPPTNMPTSKHYPDAYKNLSRKGYTDPAIAGMIDVLNAGDKDTAKKNMKAWTGEKRKEKIDERNKKYEKRAKQVGWKADSSSGSPNSSGSHGGESSRSAPAMPTSSTTSTAGGARPPNMPSTKVDPKAHEKLKKVGYTDPAIAGMITALNDANNDEWAKNTLGAWLAEKKPDQIARRNKQYADRAAKQNKGTAPTKTTTSDSRPTATAPSTSTATTKADPKAHEKLKKAGYTDQAVTGMIKHLNKANNDTWAKKTLKTWLEEKDPKQIANRNTKYAELAKKDNPGSGGGSGGGGGGGGGGGDATQKPIAVPEDAIKQIVKQLKEKKVDPEDQKKVEASLKHVKSKSNLADIVNMLYRDHRIKAKLPAELIAGERVYGEPDGKGYFYDIIIPIHVRNNIIKRLHRKFTVWGVEDVGKERDKWWAYTGLPLSRTDMEETIIPMAHSADLALGLGLYGGGKLGLDVDGLAKCFDVVKANLDVTGEMVDHMFKSLGNMESRAKAKETLGRWIQGKWKAGEREQYLRTLPSWYN
ncbi:hypothetical protein CI109_102118 [Kwoniella shandongensis]|uniref:Uncharacterized protein n=1 Tax=Kwoniella shandongensis TaxID=1734106 RepID=A0A5M6C4F3_9TREE|nr:uncharacterized protein CI109_003724 [Kwoniella shandongensis]KAA5528069.1 hypothetical protein CI109_003724 [Kwoniella shandongensis]